MNRIEIQQHYPLPFPEEIFEKRLQKILQYLKIDQWELSVVIVDSQEMLRLNQEFRGVESSTDVLSFPQEGEVLPDGFIVAGDLVFCPEEIEKNCQQFSEELSTEWLRLSIHGILHLSGQTHNGYDEEEPMLKYQEKILQELRDGV